VRKQLIIAAVVALLAGLAAPSATPSRGLIVGIYDEQSTIGNPKWAFTQYDRLGVEALRANLHWGGLDGVASSRRPANAVNPADPAYDWSRYDTMVKNSKEKGIKVVFSIIWTPRWAGGRVKQPNRAPARMIDLRNFAYAAAKRYSGSFRPTPEAPPLPAVRHWLAWNEPNNPHFLKPQFRFKGKGRGYAAVSPRIYAQMCNAIWSGIHRTGLRGEKVACGVTGPRGNNSGRMSRASLSPIPFLRGMKRAGARFDVYAHHPYYGHRSETPTTPPKLKATAVTLGNINVLMRELSRLYGRKRVWLTEYGFQTNPPDRYFGVSFARQASYLRQSFAIARRHPRIDMMLWFLLKDERKRVGMDGWQSGFYTISGRRKPSWLAFQRMPK
jgi:hypothetical protein